MTNRFAVGLQYVAQQPACCRPPCPMQVARVWDALFNEGNKVLYRVALAVLKAQEDVLLAFDNAGNIHLPG